MSLPADQMTVYALRALLQKSRRQQPGGCFVELGETQPSIADCLPDLTDECLYVVSARPHSQSAVSKASGAKYFTIDPFKFLGQDLGELTDDKPLTALHVASGVSFKNAVAVLSKGSYGMSDSGIIILNDYTARFSQLQAAFYFLRYSAHFPFEVLVTGWNKCVLVHESAFDLYEQYLLQDFIGELEEAGVSAQLSRTDIHPRARGFTIGVKSAPNSPNFYGGKWAEQFYVPSKQYLATTWQKA